MDTPKKNCFFQENEDDERDIFSSCSSDTNDEDSQMDLESSGIGGVNGSEGFETTTSDPFSSSIFDNLLVSSPSTSSMLSSSISSTTSISSRFKKNLIIDSYHQSTKTSRIRNKKDDENNNNNKNDDDDDKSTDHGLNVVGGCRKKKNQDEGKEIGMSLLDELIQNKENQILGHQSISKIEKSCKTVRAREARSSSTTNLTETINSTLPSTLLTRQTLPMEEDAETCNSRGNDEKKDAIKKSNKKTKKEKYKPTNLVLIKPAFSPPKPVRKSSFTASKAKKLKKRLYESSSQASLSPLTKLSQATEFEITCSGNFVIQDLKIGKDGINEFPESFSSQASQSLSQSATACMGSLTSYGYSDDSNSMPITSPLESKSPWQSTNVSLLPNPSNADPNKARQSSTSTNPSFTTHSCRVVSKHTFSNEKIDYENLIEQKSLGSGASSSVILVKDRTTGISYAKKIISIGEDVDPKVVLTEIKALKKCRRCPYICHFYDAFYRDSKIQILLEFMDGNSLYDVLKKARSIPENILSCIFIQVLRGLNYLHCKRGIIHRDIKPANILIKKNGEVKISDFGLTGISAKNSSYGLKNTMVFKTCQGTIMYMSPERIQERDHSFSSDIWSVGMALAELRMGCFPLKNINTYFDIMEEIMNMEKLKLPSDTFSPELRDFISNCVKIEANQRSTASQLLKHQFITQHHNGDLEMMDKISQWMRTLCL